MSFAQWDGSSSKERTLPTNDSTGKYHSSDLVSLDDFTIVKVIGRGSFGKVYLVKKKDDGKHFAMKTLKKDMILRKGQTENTKGKPSLL